MTAGREDDSSRGCQTPDTKRSRICQVSKAGTCPSQEENSSIIKHLLYYLVNKF